MTNSGSAHNAAAPELLMNIGEVLARLQVDFPSLTHSKLRFLETEGIVAPQRTDSGYRKYSLHDLQRLHLALTLQRDTFRPNKVIKELIDGWERGVTPRDLLDSGPMVPAFAAAPDGHLPGPEAFAPDTSTLRLSRRELVAHAEVTDAFLGDLEEYGLISPRPGPAPYDNDALLITRTCAELAEFGIEPRHLRAFKQAADRELGLIQQVTAAIRASREEGAKGRAEEVEAGISALSVRLHTSLVKAGLRGIR